MKTKEIFKAWAPSVYYVLLDDAGRLLCGLFRPSHKLLLELLLQLGHLHPQPPVVLGNPAAHLGLLLSAEGALVEQSGAGVVCSLELYKAKKIKKF